MKKIPLITLFMFVQLCLCAVTQAQAPGRAPSRIRADQRPAISPYYDLLNRGNRSFEFQYFRRVRPDVEFRQAENRLRQNLNSLSKRVDRPRDQSETSMLGTTGHAASFNTHRRYFNTGARSGG